MKMENVIAKKNCFKNAEEFLMWDNSHKYGVDLTLEDVKLILDYVEGHGYAICPGDQWEILLVDLDEPENEPQSLCIEELINRVCQWNYELLLDDAAIGEMRENVNREAKLIGELQERIGSRDGYCIGSPTVKELIAILSKLPQDYKVYCCGTDNHLYLFPTGNYLTIDCERYLVD